MFTIQNLNIGGVSGYAASFTQLPTDTYFNYVTLLLHGDGTNSTQNNTFIDSSSNAFTVTRTGSATQGSFSPYGVNWSNYFNGTNQYLIAPSGASTFGTGDFTVECWIYKTSAVDATMLCNATGSSDNSYWSFSSLANGTVGIGIRDSAAATVSVTGSIVIPTNTWAHVAVTRQSGLVRVFVNGVLDNSGTISKSVTARTTLIGTFQYTGYENYFPGYVSNVRIVTGTAVYTATFTPPTAPLTAISGTSLLTCQSNRFADSSTNNFALTVTGAPSVQRYNPFGTSSAYSTSAIGGSGYFNGTSDYLTAPANAALSMGTGDFTWEMWVYPITTPSGTGTSSNQFLFGYRSGNDTSPYLTLNSGSGGTNPIILFSGDTTNFLSTTFPALNNWHHIAITRSGTALKMFLNGAVVSSTTNSTNFSDASTRYIGAINGGTTYYFPGYISNLRIVKGTAVYTAAFTPPTAPLTAIANTSLLLNTINGGIYDNAMMNNLITVGNAQVSTTQSKFGGSSMYFDGSSYLNQPSSQNFALGGDFTVEAWVYLTANMSGTNAGYLTDFRGGSTSNFALGFIGASGVTKMYAYIGSTPAETTGTTTVTLNTWNHVAFVRSGSTVTMYLNGTSNGTLSASYAQGATNAVICARYTGATEYITGYIDDLRITNGYARYTSNFTAPTATLPDIGP